MTERVTGVGGVFFRARDPDALREWYAEHLGVPVNEGYVVFPESRDTHWVPFSQDTDYWPAEKQGMVNFTVSDLDAMLGQLRAAGVEVDEKIEDMEFGASAGQLIPRAIASSSGSRSPLPTRTSTPGSG